MICFIYLNVGLLKRGLVMATLGLNGVKFGVNFEKVVSCCIFGLALKSNLL